MRKNARLPPDGRPAMRVAASGRRTALPFSQPRGPGLMQQGQMPGDDILPPKIPLHGPSCGKGQLRQTARLRQGSCQCGDKLLPSAPKAAPAVVQQGPVRRIACQHRHHPAAHGFQQHRRGKTRCRRGRDDGRRAEQIPIGIQGKALRDLDPGRQGSADLRQ